MVNFWISALVFMLVAVTEALIHYSDGYYHDERGVRLVWPSLRDWWRLLTVMLFFALLHSYLQKKLD